MEEGHHDVQAQRIEAAELERLQTQIQQQDLRIAALERQLANLSKERVPAATDQATRLRASDEPTTPPADWLSIPQAAKQLGISTTAVRKRIKRGQLIAIDYRKPGRKNADYRLCPTQMEELVQAANR